MTSRSPSSSRLAQALDSWITQTNEWKVPEEFQQIERDWSVRLRDKRDHIRILYDVFCTFESLRRARKI